MTTMISEVYEAFKEANVSDVNARKAAKAIATYDKAIAVYEARFASLDSKAKKLDGQMTLVTWLLAVLIGGVATLVIKAFHLN